MDSEHEDSLGGVSLSILIEFKSNYGDPMFNASKEMTIKIKMFRFCSWNRVYFKPYDDGDIKFC